MLFMAATTFTLTRCSRTNRFRSRRAHRAKTYCATETAGLGRLIASTSTPARTPARKSSSVAETVPAATRFLWTRFVDLERTAFDIHAVEFSNGPCRVIFRPEFNKSETLRSARLPIRDHAGRDRVIA